MRSKEVVAGHLGFGKWRVGRQPSTLAIDLVD
jgi:hypothetical protein